MVLGRRTGRRVLGDWGQAAALATVQLGSNMAWDGSGGSGGQREAADPVPGGKGDDIWCCS